MSDHSHHHHHHHAEAHGSTQRLKVALFLNLSFTLIEIVGAWWTGSVAVLADAVHDLGDSLSLGLALYLQQKSSTKPSPEFTYGLKRLSLLSAFVTSTVLLASSALIAREALARWYQGTEAPLGLGMAGLAALGLAVNGMAAWRLGKGRTYNERVLSWHLIEDVLGWLAVLIGGLVIHWWQVTWVDPLLAVVIAGVVGWNALRYLIRTVLVFLQRMPEDFDPTQLRAALHQVRGVQEIHDLHVWSLDGEHHVVTLHAVVENMSEIARVKQEIRHCVSHHGGVHTTIEIETKDETCAQDCDEDHQSKM